MSIGNRESEIGSVAGGVDSPPIDLTAFGHFPLRGKKFG